MLPPRILQIPVKSQARESALRNVKSSVIMSVKLLWSLKAEKLHIEMKPIIIHVPLKENVLWNMLHSLDSIR